MMVDGLEIPTQTVKQTIWPQTNPGLEVIALLTACSLFGRCMVIGLWRPTNLIL